MSSEELFNLPYDLYNIDFVSISELSNSSLLIPNS